MAEQKTKSLSDMKISMFEKQKKRDADPAWKEMVPVYIAREKGSDTHQYVCINGRSFLVKRGEQVMVPKPVAEVIENSRKAENVAFDKMIALKEKKY